MPVKGVIFDYKTLLVPLGTRQAAQAAELIEWLHAADLPWCLFTTEQLSPTQSLQFASLGYLDPVCHISKADIRSGKNRGSPDWIDTACQALNLARHELLYVGCSVLDWRTAINSGVFYLHAGWVTQIPERTTSLVVRSPLEVRTTLKDFLLKGPYWSFSLDGQGWKLRSLLPASAELPCTHPGESFRLQDIFTYAKSVKIGDDDARDILMISATANAYMEGLLPANLYFCVYPGSKQNTINKQLSGFLDRAAKLFHGYFKTDLLVRARDAPDTSLVRWRASQDGTVANVSIATQATTVHLGSAYRTKLPGKTVVVFDDFATKGMSLEWARLLLRAGGAKEIVLLTVGKYGTSHTHYELCPGRVIDPYRANTELTASDFTSAERYLGLPGNAARHLVEIFRGMCES